MGSLVRELQAVLSVYLGIMVEGTVTGLSAVAIPAILREQEISLEAKENLSLDLLTSALPVMTASEDELSWFASCITFGLLTGSLVGGYCGGRFGPRRTILCAAVPGILAWLAVALAPGLAVLLVGRVLSGVCCSVTTANASLLVTQYSSLHRRGTFLSLFSLMLGLGVLLIYTLGGLLPWRLCCLAPPSILVVQVIGLASVVESPAWLLTHRGEEKAREALVWVRGTSQVDGELADLAATREKQASGLNLRQALGNLRRPDIHRPFLLVTANFIFVMFAGPFAMIFYGVQIFQETGTNAHLAAISVAAIRVFGGLAAIFLIKRVPRVKMAMVSMNIMMVSMAVLGAVLYMQESGAHSTALSIVPVFCVLLYMFAFGAGASPLLWVFMGEIIPADYKVLCGIIASISAAAIFAVTKLFPSLLASSIGAPGTYWLFSGVALLSNLFYVTQGRWMETRGKSTVEIREMFARAVRDTAILPGMAEINYERRPIEEQRTTEKNVG